jgi:hypothetical protein
MVKQIVGSILFLISLITFVSSTVDASFFTMHCELDDSAKISRFNFVLAPSKLATLRKPPDCT